MCKNLIYGMLAAVMLLATSCIYEDIDTPPVAEDAQVTFSLDLEKLIATRAISDGTQVDKLVYSVYRVMEDGSFEQLDIAGSENGQVVIENFESGANVVVSLAKGQTYRAAFWAQHGNCTAYNTADLANVQVSYENAPNNDENRDAFWSTLSFVAAADAVYDVVLKRPFAQVNVGVFEDDWNKAVAAGFKVEESSAVIRNAAVSMNLLTGEVGEETTDVEVTYNPATIPNEALLVNTDETTEEPERYVWLSMNYILVADRGGVADENGIFGGASATLESAEFTFVPHGDGTNIVMNEGLTNIPVQRNWRTNILGNVLTGDVNFKIKLDPTYFNDYVMEFLSEGVRYDAQLATYYIDGANGMKWFASNVGVNNGFEGQTVVLTSDVDLTGVTTMGDSFAPVGTTGERDDRNRLVCDTFKGTFDGNGNTISGLYQSGWDMGYEWGQYGSLGLFSSLDNATVKNVVLEGFECQVEGGDISFVAGSATGNCVFENIEIKDGAIGTYNNGCGGIIGWSGEGEYTFKDIKIGSDVSLGGLWGSFDSSIGGVVGQAEPGATYNFENVEINCRIDAYNDCTASYDYYNYRMCGMIIGRCEETTTIDGINYPDLSQYNMTFNNVTVNYGDWMNYHYCRAEGARAVRVEPGYAYDGIAEDYDHTVCTVHHMEWIPFDQLVGGDQYGVKGLKEVGGVTVNYPDSYYAELENQQAAEQGTE